MIFTIIISKTNNDKAQLLSTDTDSLTFEIETKNVYKDFWNSKDRFDNSEYPVDIKQFEKTNKKGIGKFKDEAAGIPILNSSDDSKCTVT